MGRREDDAATPIEHLHDAEGSRFRRWREKRQGGMWETYQHEKRGRASTQPLAPRRPLTPEEEQRAFRRDHDTGDLDPNERALLEIGVAPALTPARLARRFGGVGGILLVVLLSVVLARTTSLIVAVPIGLVGLGVVLYAISRRRPSSEARWRR